MFSEHAADTSNLSWRFSPLAWSRAISQRGTPESPWQSPELAFRGGPILSLLYTGFLWHHDDSPSLASLLSTHSSSYENILIFIWGPTSLLLLIYQHLGTRDSTLESRSHIPLAIAIGSGLNKEELGVLLLAIKRIRLKATPILIHSSNSSTLWISSKEPQGLPLGQPCRVLLREIYRVPSLLWNRVAGTPVMQQKSW